MGKMRLPLIDNDLLHRGVLYRMRFATKRCHLRQIWL